MRYYKGKNTVDEKYLVKIICNCCGKSIEAVNGIPSEEVLYVRKDWGFFSNKDTMHHEFDLCEECYDKWITGFKVPVTQEEILEL